MSISTGKIPDRPARSPVASPDSSKEPARSVSSSFLNSVGLRASNQDGISAGAKASSSSQSGKGDGGEINNSVEFRAAAEAFGDSSVQDALDARFDKGVEFIDVDVKIEGTGPSGTEVEVLMESDSQATGEGDVTATVLVGESSAVVTDVDAK